MRARARYRQIEIGEHAHRAGAGGLEPGAQLVGQRDARGHEMLTGARYRPRRLVASLSGATTALSG